MGELPQEIVLGKVVVDTRVKYTNLHSIDSHIIPKQDEEAVIHGSESD